VLNLRDSLAAAPHLEGYVATLVDDHTVEIEVLKEENLNDIFARLSALGIEVLSMRNKVNRLEEIFMQLVEGRGAQARVPAAQPPRPARLGGARTLQAGCAAMSSVALPARAVNLNVVRWIGFQTIVIREYGRIIRIWGRPSCRRW